MFGFDRWWIIVLILIIVLIVYGPGKLPEVGGAIGRAMREFRRASTDLQDEIRRSASTSPTSTTTNSSSPASPSSSDGSANSQPQPSSTDAKPTDSKV